MHNTGANVAWQQQGCEAPPREAEISCVTLLLALLIATSLNKTLRRYLEGVCGLDPADGLMVSGLAQRLVYKRIFSHM